MRKFNKDKVLKHAVCVHCRTEQQAIELLDWAHSIGLHWGSGKSYIEYRRWEEYTDDTVYYIPDGSYGNRIDVPPKTSILSFEEALDNSIDISNATYTKLK